MLEEAGVYESEDENLTEEQVEIREKAGLIRKEKAVIRHNHRLNKHRYATTPYPPPILLLLFSHITVLDSFRILIVSFCNPKLQQKPNTHE